MASAPCSMLQAQMAIGPRPSGSDAGRKTGDYIVAQLQRDRVGRSRSRNSFTAACRVAISWGRPGRGRWRFWARTTTHGRGGPRPRSRGVANRCRARTMARAAWRCCWSLRVRWTRSRLDTKYGWSSSTPKITADWTAGISLPDQHTWPEPDGHTGDGRDRDMVGDRDQQIYKEQNSTRSSSSGSGGSRRVWLRGVTSSRPPNGPCWTITLRSCRTAFRRWT